MARLLLREPNLLCLDEPTNHLDIPSCEALEQVLLTYDGTLLFVSHDRQLVSLLAEQLLVVEGGAVTLFPGTFPEWVKSREALPPSPKARIERKKVEPARPQKPRQDPAAKAQEQAAKRIADLEERLKEIEIALAEASTVPDLAAIARFGAEHKTVQAELDQAWKAWSG